MHARLYLMCTHTGRCTHSRCVALLQLETVFVLEGLGPPMDDEQRQALSQSNFEEQARVLTPDVSHWQQNCSTCQHRAAAWGPLQP